MKLVSIESPYAGNVARNIRYAKACMKDCLKRGEFPIASHLIFPDGILDDNIPEERMLGIQAGLAWNKKADKTVVYTDLGMTKGMELGIAQAIKDGRPVEYRTLSSMNGQWNITPHNMFV